MHVSRLVFPGECDEGVCVCEDGYYGEDCSISASATPTVYTPPCCDVRTTDCSDMVLHGTSFIPNQGLSCEIRTVQVCFKLVT